MPEYRLHRAPDVHAAYLVSVSLHVVAAITWIGGSLFLVLVAVPALRRTELPLAPVFEALGVRFRTVGWVCLAILVLTGVFNLYARGIDLELLSRADFWSGGFGRALAWKLAFVAAALLLSVGHDCGPSPRRRRDGSECWHAWRDAPPSSWAWSSCRWP